MFRPAKAHVATGLLFGATFLLIFVLYATPSHSHAPQFLQEDLTPWAYLPVVRKTAAPADVKITYIENNASGSFPINKEYVLIENLGGTGQNMDGWELADQAQGGTTFTFPGTLPTFTLEPGASVKVWSKHGTDTTEELFWRLLLPVWHDAGDTAYLRDQDGKLISVYSY
jgi:hypothetical protein